MRPVLRLIKLIVPYRKWIGLAVVLGTLTIGSGIGLMMTSAFIISMAALHPSIAELQVAIVGVRFFGISRGLFRYLERLISHDTTFRLLTHFRVRFYQALEPLVPARLSHLKSGDLLQRIVADIQSLENFFVRVIAPPSVSVLTVLVMSLILWRFSWRYVLIFVVFYGLAATIIPYLSIQLSRGLGKKITQIKSELNIALLDQLNGLPELLVNQRTADQQQKIHALNSEVTQLQQRMQIIDALHQGFVTLLMFGAVLVTLIIGIEDIQAQQLEGVYLALLVLGMLTAFEGVLPLPQMAQYLEENNEAAKRLFEIIDQAPLFTEPQNPLPFPVDQKLNLGIKHLYFAYPQNDTPILKNLSLKIPHGFHVAVVGPSGSGKSTLARLLIRLYDYQKGHILLNSQELKAFKQTDIREHIAYASQDFHLFTGTIAENLQLINPQASAEEMMEILKVVQLDDLAESPQKSLNYWIGEHGRLLSGGQAQRLALAQVLFKKPAILILDEVTSHLDVETEGRILRNIFDYFRERTIINITHRLSNMEEYDTIFVLQEGQLVGADGHRALLEGHSLYRHMYSVFQESLMFV